MKLGRRGQSTVEYMLLLCTATTVTLIAASALKKYLPQLLETLIEKILSAAIALASP